MPRVIVGLGSNIDPEQNMARAVSLLAAQMTILDQTPLLRTAPRGFADQPDFINTAVLAETAQSLQDLRTALHSIEDALGRVRTANQNGPRTIDLDVLVYDDEIIDREVLEVDYLRSEAQTLMPGLFLGNSGEPEHLSPAAQRFKAVLDEVFAAIKDEPWYSRATNYSVVINDTQVPHDGHTITLATTTRGGYVPTVITYYVRNFHSITFDEVYRVTKHEFAHLWTLGEADAQAVE